MTRRKTQILTVPPPLWATPGAPSGQVRMLEEELPDECGIQDMPLGDPGVLLRSVPLPLGEELAAPSPVTHLQEPSDSVGHAAVDEAGRRRSPGGGVEGRQDMGFQMRNMEHRMDAA